MILTDREIKISIENGAIGISPEPRQEAYSSTSLDLTLDENYRAFADRPQGIISVIDPSAEGYNFNNTIHNLTSIEKIEAGGFDLDPKKLILAWTREVVKLTPMSRVAARVEGKSSLARLGLGIHVTAPTIHAGFAGPIQLEIVNHGPLPIRLKVGMPICQLIFEQTLGVPEKGYSGQFAGQKIS